jgi:hypothetical protein
MALYGIFVLTQTGPLTTSEVFLMFTSLVLAEYSTRIGYLRWAGDLEPDLLPPGPSEHW